MPLPERSLPRIFAWLGRSRTGTGLTEAEAAVVRLFQEQGDSRSARLALKRAISDRPDPFAATDLLERLREQVPGSATITVQLARMASRAGRHDVAVAVARAHLAANPNTAIAVECLANALAQALEPCRALQLLEGFHAANPQTRSICRTGIRIAKWMGDLDAIRTWVARADAIDPSDPAFLIERCDLAAIFGDMGDCRPLLRTFAPTDRMSDAQATRLAFFMLRLGLNAEARRVLDHVRRRENNFALASATIACAASDGDFGAAAHAAIAIAERPTPDSRAAAPLTEIAAAIDTIDGAFPRSERKALRAHRTALLSSAPSAAYRFWIEEATSAFDAVVKTPASRTFGQDQPVRASYICPIHRPDDIDNAIRQIARQSWRNAEAIFAVNGGAVTEAHIAAAWRSDIPLRTVDCSDLGSIGAILNRAVAASAGDAILRFDADNLYLEDYAKSMLTLLQALAADIVCKRGKFIFLEDLDLLMAVNTGDAIARATFGQAAGGATFCGRRKAFVDRPFPEDCKVSEDTVFIRKAIAHGADVRLVDPFNFVSVRSGAPGAHTWNVGNAELLARGPTELVGRGDAIEREVRLTI